MVQQMQKMSKKIVSKVIYVKILLASHQNLLKLFFKQKGLRSTWRQKLICQLSCNPKATVRQNASQVLNNWMAVVATISSSPEPPMQLANTQPVVLLQSSLPQQHFLPTSSVRTTRGSRSAKPMPKTNREWHILASAQNRWDHWQTNQ